MFYTNIQSPRIQLWQHRLARVPRWAWIALFVGVVLPLVILGVGLLAVVLVSAAVVVAVAGLVMFIRNRIRRLLHPADDGRRNVKIIVHSARVIDP